MTYADDNKEVCKICIVSVRLTPAEKELIDAAAWEEHRPTSQFIRSHILDYINQTSRVVE